jgi:hypothetical protein
MEVTPEPGRISKKFVPAMNPDVDGGVETVLSAPSHATDARRRAMKKIMEAQRFCMIGNYRMPWPGRQGQPTVSERRLDETGRSSGCHKT